MEIVVHSKKSLFQQKFQKKFYHFNIGLPDGPYFTSLAGILLLI